MKPDVLEWLQSFYLRWCDDDWEHTYGVKIDTLDNPGWSVEVNLTETPFEDRPFERLEVERSEHDWYHCWLESKVFNIACGPKNLTEALEVFRDWVGRQTPANEDDAASR